MIKNYLNKFSLKKQKKAFIIGGCGLLGEKNNRGRIFQLGRGNNFRHK